MDCMHSRPVLGDEGNVCWRKTKQEEGREERAGEEGGRGGGEVKRRKRRYVCILRGALERWVPVVYCVHVFASMLRLCEFSLC